MVYAETGCTPLWVDVMQRSLSFYVKTQYSTRNNLASTMLYILHKSHHHGNLDSKYLNYIRTSLTSIGLLYLYNNYTLINVTTVSILNRIKRATRDLFMHDWHTTMTSNKAIFYKSIKHSVEFEQYLDILPKSKRISLTKFRLSNHNLPIECGSWYDVPRELRTCPTCPLHSGDEMHYLYHCPSTLHLRTTHIQRYFINRPSVYKTRELFNSKNKNTLLKLSTFIQCILKLFQN